MIYHEHLSEVKCFHLLGFYYVLHVIECMCVFCEKVYQRGDKHLNTSMKRLERCNVMVV